MLVFFTNNGIFYILIAFIKLLIIKVIVFFIDIGITLVMHTL